MRKFLTIVMVLVVVVIVVGTPFGLYFLGGEDQSALERLRDIAIILIGLLIIVTVLLLTAMVAVMVWVALTIKDNVIPALDALKEAVERIKGTTEFLSEKAAAPVISAYGSVARARTMTKVVTGRDKRKTTGSLTKLIRRTQSKP